MLKKPAITLARTSGSRSTESGMNGSAAVDSRHENSAHSDADPPRSARICHDAQG